MPNQDRPYGYAVIIYHYKFGLQTTPCLSLDQAKAISSAIGDQDTGVMVWVSPPPPATM